MREVLESRIGAGLERRKTFGQGREDEGICGVGWGGDRIRLISDWR